MFCPSSGCDWKGCWCLLNGSTWDWCPTTILFKYRTPNMLKPFQSLALCKLYSVSMCFHWLQDHPCTPFELVYACINLHMSAMSTLPFPAGNVGLWSSSPPNSYFQLLSATDLLIPTPRAQFAPFAQLSSCDHFVIFCWSCRSSRLTRSEGIETKQKKCRRHRGKYRFTSFSLAESSRPWRHPCLRSIWVGSQWIHLSMYNWTEGDTIVSLRFCEPKPPFSCMHHRICRTLYK
jgi:hypothetical protein